MLTNDLYKEIYSMCDNKFRMPANKYIYTYKMCYINELECSHNHFGNYGNYLYDCKYEDSTWTCSYGKQKDTS